MRFRDTLIFFLGVTATGFVLGVGFSLAFVWIPCGIAALGLLAVID